MYSEPIPEQGMWWAIRKQSSALKGITINGGKLTQNQKTMTMQCQRTKAHICIMGAEEPGTFSGFQTWYNHLLVS